MNSKTAKLPPVLKCPKCGTTIPDSMVATRMAEKAGKKLAATKGSDYFRELQSRRKTRAGGRPPLKKKTK